MSTAAKSTLCKLVEEHITTLVRESVSVQRHTKRARFHQSVSPSDDNGNTNGGIITLRRMLQADDINLALQWCGGEKILTTNAGGVIKSQEKVDLSAYTRSELKHRPPSEIGMAVHWLAVNGIQPNIPQNPMEIVPRTGSDQVVHRVEEEDDTGADIDTNNTGSGSSSSAVSVRQLLPRVLSEELRLYFTRVTLAIERGGPIQQDDALGSVARDSGTQELVPFFFRFVARQILENIGQAQYCLILVRLAYALISNPYLHPELHLHQIIPSLMTCVVARRLSLGMFDDHWALRQEAARTLVKLCCVFGTQYHLKPRIIVKMCSAITPDKGLSTQYGGLTAISLFGPKAVDSFILPLVARYWVNWEKALHKETNLETRFELQRCQDALLHSVTVFLTEADTLEQSQTMDYSGLSEVFGDQLVPLVGNKNEHEYFSCFL